MDANGLIALANAQLEQLSGNRRGERIGQPVEDLIPAVARSSP